MVYFMVDLRINETLQTGAVFNRTYRVGLEAVRLEAAPTGDESVYLFLEFTIVGFEVIMQPCLMVLFEVRVQPSI